MEEQYVLLTIRTICSIMRMNISKGEKNMDENLKYNTLDNGNTDVQNKENEKDESLALSENVIESDAINNESEMQIPNASVNKKFCKYCGNEILDGNDYCSYCVISVNDPNIKHCPKCGALLEKKQKFCVNCGYKLTNMNIKANIDKNVKSIKTSKQGKTISKIIAIVVILAILVGTGAEVLPKIFVSTETLLSQGEYEKAYKKAKNGEKDFVLYENIIAVLAQEYKKSLKNPDSFKLNNVWIDVDDDMFVLSISGSNSYGGTVSNYALYTYDTDKNDYSLWASVSDLEEEEIYSFDDYEDEIEKLLDNAARKNITKIIYNESYEVKNGICDRINGLNEKKLLSKISYIEEVKNLKHSSSDESDSEEDNDESSDDYAA